MDPLRIYSVLSSLPLKGRSAKKVTGQTALARLHARARWELYHHVALQHLQPWGPVGLQQSVHHVLELVLLLSRNAIPGLSGNKAEAKSRQGPWARKHVLGASCVLPQRAKLAQARSAGTGAGEQRLKRGGGTPDPGVSKLTWLGDWCAHPPFLRPPCRSRWHSQTTCSSLLQL